MTGSWWWQWACALSAFALGSMRGMRDDIQRFGPSDFCRFLHAVFFLGLAGRVVVSSRSQVARSLLTG